MCLAYTDLISAPTMVCTNNGVQVELAYTDLISAPTMVCTNNGVQVELE